MLRVLKWGTGIVIGLLGLAIILVLIVPNVIDWNRYKPDIESAVRQATGRDLRIDGDVRISVWPDLNFSFGGIRLANAPGMAPSDMGTISNVTGKVALWPLLRKTIEVDSLIVDNASVHLAIDKDGNPNWTFRPSLSSEQKPETEAQKPTGTPWSVQLGDVRLARSEITYQDATTGQNLDVKDIGFTVAMADTEQPLSINGQMTVNALPVTVNFLVDTPNRLIEGQKAKVSLKLSSERVTATYVGAAQQRPIPALDGTFDLDVPSAGQLAAWLGRPLEKSLPDPGALKAHAEFAAEGSKAVLKELTITGNALSAKASGSLDTSGQAPKLILQIQSGILDVDRYLPPASKIKSQSASRAAPRAELDDVYASIPNTPIDLSWLHAAEVDVNVAIAGIKAAGYEVGNVALAAQGKGGLLKVDLRDLSLYGGKITGNLNLDSTGKVVVVQSTLKVDHVRLDDLSRVAAAGALPVTGVASATLDAASQGATPRTLAENVHCKLTLDLGGMEVKNAPAGAISGIKLAMDIPGADQPSNLNGSIVYNKQQVDLALKLNSLKKVLSGQRFVLSTDLKSELATVRYDGSAMAKPTPSLDGKLDLDVASFGRLVSWLGSPLPPSQADPGPLKLQATFKGENTKTSFQNATIEGKALKATASGEIDYAQKVPAFNVNLDITNADLNAYFPASGENTRSATPGQTTPVGWSERPYDLAPLSSASGQFVMRVASTHYRELNISKGSVKATLSGGVLKIVLEQVALAQGTIDGSATIDGTNRNSAKVAYQIAVAGAEGRDLLKSFAGTGRLSGKLNFKSNGTANGQNEKQMIGSLNGGGEFKFQDGAIQGINLAEVIRQAKSLGTAGSETEKTDFAELSGTYSIKNGLLENKDLQMLAPLIRLTGEGTVDLPNQTIDYLTEAKLVGTIQGQGGDAALAGLPIPVKITGSWNAPKYEIDWKTVLLEAAKDPQRLQQLPAQLKQMGKGMNLPIQGLGGQPPQGTGATLPIPGAGTLPGGAPVAPPQQPSGAGDILKSIPGLIPR